MKSVSILLLAIGFFGCTFAINDEILITSEKSLDNRGQLALRRNLGEGKKHPPKNPPPSNGGNKSTTTTEVSGNDGGGGGTGSGSGSGSG
eukprot:CAMPEP_0195527324 /NCGR_PEP_ID=MMETSP0794_2-20130614/28925_1 /TAXON_ID=515487 /ORGANISM="Stephanopyxis turris, Strain CCMP 815" /LENGTH=89 /DNA_ID=CAMNT_0040658213 /DNA_START=55 /DNA_END=320 /DNA_ORIENTATION=+